MSLRVKDVLELEYLEEFKLIAGNNGLDRFVNNVGILDYEIIDNTMDVFVEGELILATFSVARDNESIVFNCVKKLIEQKTAGLAIKTVFYKSLAQYILDYADEHKYPIFTYHPSIYSENIIRTVFNGIKTRGHHTQLEVKLETLYKGELNPHVIKELANEINPSFRDVFYIAYCEEKRFLSEDNSIRIVDKFLRIASNSLHQSVIKFRKGFIVVLTSSESNQIKLPLDLQHIFTSLSLDMKEFTIGLSEEHNSLYEFDICLKESYISYQSAIYKDLDLMKYHEAGVNKLLMPFVRESWSLKYASDLLKPVFDYDAKYVGNLYETVKQYFASEANSDETAKLMFQHKNTILYRLRKVKELCGPFNSEHEFQTEMSLAIKINELNKLL